MPTYNYRCTNPDCLYETEFFHGINEKGIPKCPRCGVTMGKLVSAPPFKFKQKRGTMGVQTMGPRGIERSDIS